MSTTRTASQAAARSLLYSRYTVGYCLNFVWNCISAPKSYGCPDANAAWTRATQKVRTGTPPAGAPVYFRGGAHGHIAISLGGGRIRSTDWPTKGRVGTTTIGDLCREWYGSQSNYRGWSRDLCGDPIPGLQIVASATDRMSVDLSSPIRIQDLKIGKTNGAVGRFQKALWNIHGRTYRAGILRLTSRASIGAGVYGSVTVKMCSDAFAGLGSDRHTQPGRWLLTKLGFKDIRS